MVGAHGDDREVPSEPPLRLEVSGEQSEPIVRIAGEIDIATAPLVRAELAKLVNRGAQQIRLDLADVAFIDSSGLGVLVGTLRRLREERDGGVRIDAVQDGVRRVFEITGLGPMFGIAPR
jgi:anti-sigma B factor antagonist